MANMNVAMHLRLVDEMTAGLRRAMAGLHQIKSAALGSQAAQTAAAVRTQAAMAASAQAAGGFAAGLNGLQNHYQAFMDMLKWQVASRAEFDRLMGLPPDHLTDLQRAARFLYLQKMAFGGKVAGRSFGVATTGPARFDPARLAPVLEAAHERLGGVYIECLPLAAFMERWDRPGTLFYCDPPYWGSEDYYGRGMFPKPEFEAFAEHLKRLKGRFIVTLNDCPEVRALFDWACLETADIAYTLSGGSTAARELIITPPDAAGGGGGRVKHSSKARPPRSRPAP